MIFVTRVLTSELARVYCFIIKISRCMKIKIAPSLPDNGCIDLILPVLENSLLCRLLLIICLLQLDLERSMTVSQSERGSRHSYLVDLDLVESVGEVLVVGEPVSVIDVFTFRYLGQHSRLPTRQRLK